MEIIKRIWNYFFPEKKKGERKPWMTDKVIEIAKQSIDEFKGNEEKPKPHTPIYYYEHHKMSFKKSQPIGRILTYGKNRFRIHNRISSAKKFKYDVEILN